MIVTYGLTEEFYSFGDSNRVSFGIAVYSNAVEEGTVTIIASARDISGNKNRISDLIEQCNRLNLNIVHLYDVIEDFLADEI